MPISIITADITQLRVGAIVNAANASLLGGGGVDGAIHHVAGPALLAACRTLAQVTPGVRCPTGEARITPGFELPATWVIHTVGPVWRDGHHGEPALLGACYRNAMALARRNGVHSVAFPAISCGVYGYPPAQAAKVAVATLRTQLAHADDMAVTLCCFSASLHAAFAQALSAA